MTFLTLAQTIEQLLALKEVGMPGDTPVAVPSSGRNGEVWQMKVSQVATVAVDKTEFKRGLSILKCVASRGVKVVSIC